MNNIVQLTQTIHLFSTPVFNNARGSRNKKKQGIAEQTPLPGLELESKPTQRPQVTNRQIAEVLSDIADILERQAGNQYRIAAYRHAARGILALEEPASTILARGEALPVPGLGDRLRVRISELVETGAITFFNALYAQSLPSGVRALLFVRNVGLQTALRLYDELGVDSPEKLYKAANEGKIHNLAGFGPRSEARLKVAAQRYLAGQKRDQQGVA